MYLKYHIKQKKSIFEIFFQKCGKINSFFYPKVIEKGYLRPKGYALLTFASEEEAEECVLKNGVKMFGRKLTIKFRNKGRILHKPKDCRIIFISNLSFKITVQDLSNLFSKCGNIIDVGIPQSKKGFRYGIAYVEFSSTEAVDKAMELEGISLLDRPIEINWAFPNETIKLRNSYSSSKTIFIKNLPTFYSIKEIKTFLLRNGIEESKFLIRVQKRFNQTFKGQCFIDFE